MTTFTRVGEFELIWGESTRWDDRRQRLYFVDCATRCLHWLEGGEPPLQTLDLLSLPTGVVLTEGNELVVCLDGGLHVVDPDSGAVELLAPYPEGILTRANDANADGYGNLVTGSLNITVAPGTAWWFSATEGWRLVDEDISNMNGPLVTEVEGQPTLIIGDTGASAVFAYPYDPDTGAVGERRVFGDHAALGGAPDGATADAEGAVWSCVLRTGKLARFTAAGVDRVLDMPSANPADVAFGGPGLDRLFVASIAVDLGQGPPPPEASWLVAFDGVGQGRPEARFRLN